MEYLYMHEKLHAQHCEELQREIEQARAAELAAGEAPGIGRHAVGQLGKALVALGTWMERAEQRSEMPRLVTAKLQCPE